MFLQALRAQFPVTAIVSSRSSYAGRIADVVWLLLTRRHHYDVVILGFLAQPLFPFVRLLTRKPILADVYFSLYDTVVHDKGVMGPRHPVSWLARFLDRYTCRRSLAVFTDTQAHAAYLAEATRRPLAHFHRIWISAQTDIFRPLRRISSAGEACPFAVLFYGGFIPLQGVDVIIRAAALLHDANIFFHIVGNGQTYADCRQLDADARNPNTRFHGWQPQARIMELATRCHLVLGVFGATPKASRVIPNKVFEGLAMGKPVLTAETPAIRELLTPGDDVLTCPAADPAALADKLCWCSAHRPHLEEIGASGYRTFSRHASPAVLAADLARVVRTCIDTRHH